MEIALDSSWRNRLENELSKPYFESLMKFVESEYSKFPNAIFPEKNQMFRAFKACPFEDVKVVILGQDPYPTKGHAHGLCFSVAPHVLPLPKSLKNIYKELESDLGVSPREDGNLNVWAEQGVLMLNSILTVREGEAMSHKRKGWETFTDAVIGKLNAEKNGIVYILWGNGAIEKAKNVDAEKNLILSASHPSPLGAYRSFWGSKPFSKSNDYLRSNGKKAIEW